MNIGVVTSGSGAAIHDIQDSIFNRWPCAKLHLFDTAVQGEGAVGQIAAAIAKANRKQKALQLDVLIIGRGGGSMEDLWAFNEEPVARAIFASRIPVISAVGHEVDVTIADLVADARASTPTKAGVIAVPDYREELGKLDSFSRRLRLNLRSVVQRSFNQLQTVLASRVFKSPLGPLQVAAQRVDEIERALIQIFPVQFSRLIERLNRMRAMLQRIEPVRLLASHKLDVHRLDGRNQQATHKILSKKQLQLTGLENRLRALDPRSVLGRGYSITLNERTGTLVTEGSDVQINDALTTELAKGRKIHSRVEKVE
jgi:exodeoxyribonuclease VII large subunit